MADHVIGASARRAGRNKRRLFDKRKHTRQSVLDRARAILVNIAAEADRVGHIAPDGRAGFLKFAQKERLFGAVREQHLDRLQMRACHGENMGGALDEHCRQWLTAQASNVYAFGFANLHRIQAWWLAAHGVNACRAHFDIFAIAN